MNEPSNGVPPQLLSHIHLVSTYRYPTLSHTSIDTIVDYLLQAPKITREVAAMNWMFLDAPPDGTVMLVWQPSNQLGKSFASDGYVWADVEQQYNHEHRGYMVEMHFHRSGYHPPHEQLASHSRRRYRLPPLSNANPNLSPCDPSLWIVHYTQAELNYRIPSSRILVSQQVHQEVSARRFLQQHGQLVRKEFMLHDRNNWPTINLPSTHGPQLPQASGYPGNVISHLSRNQQFPDPQQGSAHQPGVGPSPAKRPRQTAPTHRPGSSTSIAATAIAHDSAVEEEEDTSRGDLMDFLTPRDISTMRFTQHHEWMEEVFSSPYGTGQIIPVDLGLGRKGELESLTRDFFEAPTGVSARTNGDAEPARIGKMDPGKADDFTKRATERVAEIHAEIEKMKLQHAKRMAKLGKGSLVRDAEKRLRNAVTSSAATGADFWTPEAQAHDRTKDDTSIAALRQQEQVDEISHNVALALGKQIEVISPVTCIQKGGLEEKIQPDMFLNGDDSLEIPSFDVPDHDLQPSLQHLPASTTSYTPGNGLTAPDANGMLSQSTHPSALASLDLDTTMSDLPAPEPIPKDATEAGDWVLVSKEPSPTHNPQHNQPSPTHHDLGGGAFDDDALIQESLNVDSTTNTPNPSHPLPDFSLSTDLGPASASAADVTFNADDFVGDAGIDFGAMDDDDDDVDGGAVGVGVGAAGGVDVAGLTGFDGQIAAELVGGEENADLGLDDSAFGDALIHTEVEGDNAEV